jgi:hypothetical protein
VTSWVEYHPADFQDFAQDTDGYWFTTSSAPVDEWRCTKCDDPLGFHTGDGEGGGGWTPPWCPSEEFDEATMVCEGCTEQDVEVGCAVCGETGLPTIGHADTCRGSL